MGGTWRQHYRGPKAATLTDKKYDTAAAAKAVWQMSAVGVETGGSNVQFAARSRARPGGGNETEPAAVTLERAGVEGDRRLTPKLAAKVAVASLTNLRTTMRSRTVGGV